MPIRDSQPVTFLPVGLSDSVDQDQSFNGACNALQNFVFDRVNRRGITCRPGVGTAITSFPTFTTPGVISVEKVVGDRVYGLISSGRNSGKDEPFCYSISGSTFVTVAGIQSSNVPTTQPTTGAWTPPTMDVVGSQIMVSHPGFTGGNKFGGFDTSGYSESLTATLTSASATLTGTTPTGLQIGYTASGTGIPSNTYVTSFTTGEIILNNAATAATSTTVTLAGGTSAQPLWFAGDLNTNPLPSVATNVSQFFNRAYYACGNTTNFSDVLSATVRTNASQALTHGDSSAIVALHGIPYSTATEGILQGLLVFKAPGAGIWQITGDSALGTLSNNQISGTNGTLAPRSVHATPVGVAYMDSDGVRVANQLGTIGFLNSDIVQPFIYATTPSRAAGCYSNSTYRLCLDTVLFGTSTSGADFWYDLLFQKWNGPHTFPYDCASAYQGDMVLASNTYPAKLFLSSVQAKTNSVYLDDGLGYVSTMTSAFLPIASWMCMKAVIESTLELVSWLGAQYTVNVSITDENADILDSVSLNSLSIGSAWGNVTWGSFDWAATREISTPTSIPWTIPLVFNVASLSANVVGQKGVSLKAWNMRLQKLIRTVANG